jgi:hypothetical protein
MTPPRPRSALSAGLVLLVLAAAGCGSSSSSSSSASATSTATSSAPSPAATSTTSTGVQPKVSGSASPRVSLRTGQSCSIAKRRTYTAHGLSCVHGRLRKVAPSHKATGSSGGAGIGSGSSSGGAPVSGP